MLYEVATWLAGTAAMGVMVEENKTKKEKNPWSMTGDFFELQLITLRSKASSRIRVKQRSLENLPYPKRLVYLAKLPNPIYFLFTLW
ncbi:MAG: hypothetical protein M1119_06115 [Firmicutes bacterium]|nr:hypothetical protein [Bacillota bacterium]